LSGAKNEKQLARVLGLLGAVPALSLDDRAADAASEIRKSLERSGHSIGMADSLIAGIVTNNGGRLLTRNRRYFERVPGLTFA
jgi:predicted nucleic acid-binding protein